MVTIAASDWLRSAVGGAQREQPLFLGAHRVRQLADPVHGAGAGAGARTHRGGVVELACLDEARCTRANCVEPRLDCRRDDFDQRLLLSGLSRGQLLQLVAASAGRCRPRPRELVEELRPDRSADSRARRFRRGGSAAAASEIWFSTSTVCTTQAASSRALLQPVRREATLIATSTRNATASSRICRTARRRAASGVTARLASSNMQIKPSPGRYGPRQPATTPEPELVPAACGDFRFSRPWSSAAGRRDTVRASGYGSRRR